LAVAAAAIAIIVFWDEIVAVWKAAVDIMVGVIEDFAEFFRFVWNETGAFLTGLFNLWLDAWKFLIGGFVTIVSKIGSVLAAPFVFAFEVISSVIGGIVDAIGGLVDLVGGALTSAFEFLGEVATAVGDAIMFVFRLVQAVLEPIVAFLIKAKEIAGDVFDFVSDIGGSIVDFGAGIGEAAFDAFGDEGGVTTAGSIAAGRGKFGAGNVAPVSPVVATAGAGGPAETRVTVAGGKTEVTSNIKIELDGEVVATAVTKQLAEDGRRRSQPTPGGID
jgi:phage-related protein